MMNSRRKIDSVCPLFNRSSVYQKQSDPLKFFLDKMLWFFAPAALALTVYAAYNTIQYFTWIETTGKVLSIDYTCHSTKRGWSRSSRSKIYYTCGDQSEIAFGRKKGYEPSGARELKFSIQFKTIRGELKVASIAEYEQDVLGKKKDGVYLIKYSQFNPLEVQFSDLLLSSMRDFWLMAFVAGIVAFFCRKIQKDIR